MTKQGIPWLLVFLIEISHPTQGIDELIQMLNREHDGVPTPSDIFRDLEESTSIVLFEIHKEHFAVRDHFFCI